MKIELFTRSGCHNCEETKRFLKNRNIPFTEKEIGVKITREELIEKWPDVKILPICVVDDVLVGSHYELMRMITENG